MTINAGGKRKEETCGFRDLFKFTEILALL
jgi:hypothetical protein